MKIDEAEARRQVNQILNVFANERTGEYKEPSVITDVRAVSGGWFFFYEDRRHLEDPTSEFALAGNMPIFVRESDGVAFFSRWDRAKSKPAYMHFEVTQEINL